MVPQGKAHNVLLRRDLGHTTHGCTTTVSCEMGCVVLDAGACAIVRLSQYVGARKNGLDACILLQGHAHSCSLCTRTNVEMHKITSDRFIPAEVQCCIHLW